MDEKTWLKLKIIFGFVSIYVVSSLSLLLLILSYLQIISACFYIDSLLLFILAYLIFEDTCSMVEELTILKIKECEEK